VKLPCAHGNLHEYTEFFGNEIIENLGEGEIDPALDDPFWIDQFGDKF